MQKKFLLGAFASIAFAVVPTTEAQQAKIYQIGVLAPPGRMEERAHIRGLRDGLKEAGYQEGRNLLLDIPANVKTYDELRPIAKSYAEKKVSIIATQGATSTIIAQRATTEIPIVFVWGITDPVGVGLVKSLARPETNITGVTNFTGPEIHGKRLELFKEVIPSLRRVDLYYNNRNESPGHAKSLEVLRTIAPKLAIKLMEKPIKSATDAVKTVVSLKKGTVDGIFVVSSGLFTEPCPTMVATATQKGLALVGCAVQLGALLSYEPDGYRTGHRGAWYIDKILKGEKPADLPVERPTKFEFVVNLQTAKQIGLIIPPNVLMRADRVIR